MNSAATTGVDAGTPGGAVDALSDDGLDAFEPSLLPPSPRLLRRFPLPALHRRYAAFLEERIQRDARNLRAHVERVRQRAALEDRDGLFAALADLFIALGALGQPLRANLLQECAPLLADAQRELLRSRLDSGLAATDPAAAVPGSLLSRQVAGTTRLVSRGADDGAVALLAREAAGLGDDESACQLLEEALEFDPGQPALSSELLALYRRTGRRGDFERARTRLLGRRVALAEQWEATAEWFRERDGANRE